MMAEMARASAKSAAEALGSAVASEDSLIAAVIAAAAATSDFTQAKLGPALSAFRGLAGAPETGRSAVACPLNPGGASGEEAAKRFYEPAIQGVVNFAQELPGFGCLPCEDQFTLLKGGMFEVLLLRLAILFTPQDKSLLLLDGSVYRRGGEAEDGPGALFLVDSLFDFLTRFQALGLTDGDLAVFTAVILLAPDRPGLRAPDLVTRLAAAYREALRKLLAINHPADPNIFLHLMLKIPDLRTLNTLHQEKVQFQDKVRPTLCFPLIPIVEQVVGFPGGPG